MRRIITLGLTLAVGAAMWWLSFSYNIDGHIDARQLAGELGGTVIEIGSLGFLVVPFVEF
jgi:hypothetical protein